MRARSLTSPAFSPFQFEQGVLEAYRAQRSIGSKCIHQDVGYAPSRKRARSEVEPGAFTVVSNSAVLGADGDDEHDPSLG